MRRLNILADKALLAAFSENKHIVTAKHVHMAAQDSGYDMKKSAFYYTLIGLLLVSLVIAGGYYFYINMPKSSALLLPRTETPLTLPTQTQTDTQINTKTTIQQQLAATQQWLEQMPAHYYTLQVMQSYGDKSVEIERLLKKTELEPFLNDLHPYYQAEKELWGIVYGQFENAELAQQAIGALPTVLQKNKPYAFTLKQFAKKFE